jgi:hypothetical protein
MHSGGEHGRTGAGPATGRRNQVRLSSLSGLERLLAPYGVQPLPPVQRRPFSLVFPARQATTGQALFVKLLTSRSAVARRNFGREIDILRALAGWPGVKPLHTCDSDGLLFHACGRVQGRSLFEIARAPVPDDVALLGYGRALARWIAELHRRGIVHGDLSPDHVFVEADGSLAVIGFGRGRRTQALPADERRRYEAYDVQALGMILWEMMCQSAIFPYRGRTLHDVLEREAALLREAELPAEVRRLLMGCFAAPSEFTPRGLPPYRGFAAATEALGAFA